MVEKLKDSLNIKYFIHFNGHSVTLACVCNITYITLYSAYLYISVQKSRNL